MRSSHRTCACCLLPAADLIEALEDELFALRKQLGGEAFPRSAADYLNDWAHPDKGWLRKFYRQGSDEAQFDLMPATEKAIAWLCSLAERSFVGTESRLLTLFELLRQMSEGSEADPQKRIAELQPERRTRRIHYDWLEAGEHTQRTVAQLSQQLRHFLDDKAWLENRRIMDLLRGIEGKALALRGEAPAGTVMEIADTAAAVELPMERPLHTPAGKARIAPLTPAALLPDDDGDASPLFNQVVVDKARLARNVRHALQSQAQITLNEIAADYPLRHGLAELVAYLQLGDARFQTLVDESVEQGIFWPGLDSEGRPVIRRARLPRVIFVRNGKAS